MPRNYISNKDETVRMFQNNFLEALSKVHWSVPLFVFLPAIFYFMCISFFNYSLSILDFMLYFLIGIIIWTITEYLLHRFIFHYEPQNKFGKRLHFIFHGVHHDYPKDSKRLVMPPSVSIPLAFLFYVFFNFAFGEIYVSAFFTGFLTGYLFYDITHYAIHHYNTKNKIWLYIKNHHMRHHYLHSDKGYGVSQPLWDFVFKTNFSDKKQDTEQLLQE